MNSNSSSQGIMERFTEYASKFAALTYIQVLKNAFQMIMPLFILAGFGTLLNSVVFPLFLEGDVLEQAQIIGSLIGNGTLNISGLLIAGAISYNLAGFRGFQPRIIALIVSVASFFTIMAITIVTTPIGMENTVQVTGLVSYTNLGTPGIFTGIIVGFVATELFIRLTKVDALKIKLGENVPPSVGENFSSMIPLMIVVTAFAILSATLIIFFNTTLNDLISIIIQEPLQNFSANLWGYLILYSLGVILFSVGIHNSVTTSSILQPLLLISMSQNMEAAAVGEVAPNIINDSFRVVFGQIGGTGSTIPLLIAIFIVSKYEPYRTIAKLSIGPGIFNINEPVIYGMPVVFNIALMIPFILSPIIGTLIGYFATWIGFINPFTVLVPWTMPPLVDGFLASGGDFKVPIVQLIIITVCTFLYIPFLKISERVAKRDALEMEGN